MTRYLAIFAFLIFYVAPAYCAPANPTGLAATPGVNLISLSWSPVSGATGYRVYRSENGGSTYTSAIYASSATSFTDKRGDVSTNLQSHYTFTAYLGLEYGKTYTYKVTAYDGSGESTGATVSSAPVAAAAYTGGTVRGKAVVALIVVATDHMTSSNPTKAQIQTMHDFLRANITTKITLFVSKQILFATSGEPLNILNYMKTLVSTYNYDIVTLPHRAWFPTTTAWSQGISTEVQNIQDCHDKCVSVFGKAPVASWAWAYNEALLSKAVSMGYKIAPSGFREQPPTHPDGWGSLGFPFHLFRPSKNSSLVPGGGSTSNTMDIVTGFTALQGNSFRQNGEPFTSGKNNGNEFGNNDSSCNLFANQDTLVQMMEDSQVATFNQFNFVPMYYDAYWSFVDGLGSTVSTTGDPEVWYMTKQMALFTKQRYSSMIDFMSAGEFANYVYTTIPVNDPHPPYAELIRNEHEGWGTPEDKGIRYDCQNYSVVVKYRAGSSGYIQNIQEVPYSPSLVEPAAPTGNWNIPGGWFRSNSTNARLLSFTRGGTSYSINSGSGMNIHPPAITSNVAARSMVLTWDIYDASDTTRLLTLKSTFAPSGLVNTYTYQDSSVTAVTETNNLTSVTAPILYENGASIYSTYRGIMRGSFR